MRPSYDSMKPPRTTPAEHAARSENAFRCSGLARERVYNGPWRPEGGPGKPRKLFETREVWGREVWSPGEGKSSPPNHGWRRRRALDRLTLPRLREPPAPLGEAPKHGGAGRAPPNLPTNLHLDKGLRHLEQVTEPPGSHECGVPCKGPFLREVRRVSRQATSRAGAQSADQVA